MTGARALACYGEQEMRKDKYKLAKLLVTAPIAVMLFTAICFGIAFMLESYTGRGAVYSVFAGSGILSALLSPLPCLAASVAGIVCARHSVKAGNKKARKFFIIGIIAATVSVMETLLTVTLLYMSISV